MKIIVIGGEPATGKSRLMRKIKGKREFKSNKYKKLLDYEKKGDLIIFGRYEGEKFDGTDRLAMSVQPVAVDFVKKTLKKNPDTTIIFEGDRLFNKKFIQFISKTCPFCVIILTVSQSVKDERHKDREDTQTETFLKSRKTKVANVNKAFKTLIWTNENLDDLKENRKRIKGLIKADNKQFKKLVEKLKDKNESLVNKSEGIMKFM